LFKVLDVCMIKVLNTRGLRLVRYKGKWSQMVANVEGPK
jgi:hypothetical protein